MPFCFVGEAFFIFWGSIYASTPVSFFDRAAVRRRAGDPLFADRARGWTQHHTQPRAS